MSTGHLPTLCRWTPGNTYMQVPTLVSINPKNNVVSKTGQKTRYSDPQNLDFPDRLSNYVFFSICLDNVGRIFEQVF